MSVSGMHNMTYINATRGAMWDYCRCDTPTNKLLHGSDELLFGGAASWDATKSTMILTVAPGQQMYAGQPVDVSFVIRDPGVQIESGLPDYMWARVAAKVVDPYLDATCSSVDSMSVTSAGDAGAMRTPRGTPRPSATTMSFVPFPRLVLPISAPLFLQAKTSRR